MHDGRVLGVLVVRGQGGEQAHELLVPRRLVPRALLVRRPVSRNVQLEWESDHQQRPLAAHDEKNSGKYEDAIKEARWCGVRGGDRVCAAAMNTRAVDVGHGGDN